MSCTDVMHHRQDAKGAICWAAIQERKGDRGGHAPTNISHESIRVGREAHKLCMIQKGAEAVR